MRENWRSLTKKHCLYLEKKREVYNPKDTIPTMKYVGGVICCEDASGVSNPVMMGRILNKRSTCKDFERISQADMAPGEKLPPEDQSEHY